MEIMILAKDIWKNPKTKISSR